ncbi:MAG: 50S ribosomal protein L25 [Bradymonadaceae bacterium]|nr:50S ribosomal protein L25 [Lujinxingiaceae bacterium]
MEAQQNPTLDAQARSETGKGVARRLRADGLIPAVCYGIDTTNTPLAINPSEFDKILATKRRQNTVFSIKLDAGKQIDNVMLRDYQVDPIKRTLLHADLMVVDMKELVDVVVPVESIGRPLGVRMGGRLRLVRPEIKVQCRPGDIPESIVIDVNELGPESVFMASDVNWPAGVTPGFKDNFAMARIIMPRKVAVKAEDPKAKKKGKK